jgi:hypothetical protein
MLADILVNNEPKPHLPLIPGRSTRYRPCLSLATYLKESNAGLPKS